MDEKMPGEIVPVPAVGNTIENPPEYSLVSPQKCVALGRPTIHNKALVIDYICEQIRCSSYGIHRILKNAKKSSIAMPTMGEILQWIQDDEEFLNSYNTAKQFQADFMVDELIDIADDSRNDWMERNDPTNPGYKQNGEHLARTKMRLDTRKWCAAKLRPKKYGERQDVTLTTELTLSSLTLDQLQQRLEALRLNTLGNTLPALNDPMQLDDIIEQSAEPLGGMNDAGERLP